MELITPSDEKYSYRKDFSFRVRMFNRMGFYPRGICASKKALYIADDEVVFTVIQAKRYDQLTSNFPYSEMDWATPQEVHLWASILLCEDTDGPWTILYPEHTTLGYLDPLTLDLRDSEIQKELRDCVLDKVKMNKVSTTPFRLFEDESYLDRQSMFYSRIDESNHVLLRGITCLIKCDMLSRYYEFTEEAIIVAFIALEASFSLVVQFIKRTGIDNPTSHDAGLWLDDTFNRPLGIDPGERKYFEELYEQRVMTMHPSSRYGDCLYAPLMADDLIDLRRDLREVFAYLVSGDHGPEFSRRLKQINLG